MKEQLLIRIRTQSRSKVYFNISLLITISTIGAIFTLVFWSQLDVLYRSTLIGSFTLSIPYILMYVFYIELEGERLTIKFPHKKVCLDLSDIDSVRVTKKLGVDSLKIRTVNRVGFRNNFSFTIKNNENEVTDFLNYLLDNGCKIFSNSMLKTKVIYNKEAGRFEREV